MTGPSRHLSWAELACRDGAPYPIEWRETRAAVLALEFERIRAVVDAPIAILSAYRTPEHNRRVGGARNSQHVQGRALDLRPPTGWSIGSFYVAVKALARGEDSALWGLGRYPSFLHVDIRLKPAHGRLVVWQGREAWTEGKEPAA